MASQKYGKKEVKTNVMRILDTEGITYQEHTYDISDLIDGVSVTHKSVEKIQNRSLRHW